MAKNKQLKNKIKNKPIMTTQITNSTFKDIIEAQIIEQAIKAKHDIKLDTYNPDGKHEIIFDCENYSLFIEYAFGVEVEDIENSRAAEHHITAFEALEIRLTPADSDIKIELNKEQEKQLVESLIY